jgi:molecular chaperone DnaK (HSP70)
MLEKLFKYNKDIINQLNQTEKMNASFNRESYDDYLLAVGAAIQSYNLYNINNKCTLIDICPISFGIETLDGQMEFVIEKGIKIPAINKKFIKIKKENDKNSNYLEINIYEGENKEVINNKLISCANISKRNFKNEKICNNYIELLIQFEVDKYCHLRVYVLEPKTLKKRFECLINIDIIKG